MLGGMNGGDLEHPMVECGSGGGRVEGMFSSALGLLRDGLFAWEM